jgi:hypothetical protein
MFSVIFKPLRLLDPHWNVKSVSPSKVEVLWMARFLEKKKKEHFCFWIECCPSPPPDICPFSLAWQSVLGLSLPGRHMNVCLPHISSTQHSITPSLCHWMSIPRLPLGPAQISHAWGLYSPFFCLALSFPLSFCRARSTTAAGAPTTSDFGRVYSVIKPEHHPWF